mmetsp:Transcript_9898/g.23283  ORF Transcript_9898/g.23283 Transcript_9898/m.23283 type:complete len:296 (-) Transcript_9898:20-907(-)
MGDTRCKPTSATFVMVFCGKESRFVLVSHIVRKRLPSTPGVTDCHFFGRTLTRRIHLINLTGKLDLFAAHPRIPWCSPTTAVHVGVFQNFVVMNDRTILVKSDCSHTAFGFVSGFRVAYVNPATVIPPSGVGKRCSSIRQDMKLDVGGGSTNVFNAFSGLSNNASFQALREQKIVFQSSQVSWDISDFNTLLGYQRYIHIRGRLRLQPYRWTNGSFHRCCNRYLRRHIRRLLNRHLRRHLRRYLGRYLGRPFQRDLRRHLGRPLHRDLRRHPGRPLNGHLRRHIHGFLRRRRRWQ